MKCRTSRMANVANGRGFRRGKLIPPHDKRPEDWQAQSEYTEALFNWAAKKDAAERELRNSRPREVVIDDAVKAAERMLEDEDMAAEDKRKIIDDIREALEKG